MNLSHDKLEQHRSLMEGRKSTNSPKLKLSSRKPKRDDWNLASYPLSHEVMSQEADLVLEMKVVEYERFKFQIHCKDIHEQPVFRYDSAGSAHRNKYDDVPLNEQVVDCPHFNTFDTAGRPWAYKTPQLLDPNETEALKDINLAFIHFCFEANIRYGEDSFSEIDTAASGALEFTSAPQDILANVTFVKGK